MEPRVASLSSLGSEVRGIISHVLLAAMTATHKLYRSPTPPTISHNISIMNSTAAQASPVSKVSFNDFYYCIAQKSLVDEVINI